MMNELAKAFAIAHRMGHDRPDVPEEEREEFRRIARLIWKSVEFANTGEPALQPPPTASQYDIAESHGKMAAVLASENRPQEARWLARLAARAALKILGREE